MRRAGFLVDQGWPLFLSEFGLDQRGTNENDNRYFSCMLGTMAELDLDWALWALQGSYYVRDGALGFDEPYGVLAWDWGSTQNSSLLQRIQAIQPPFQGPGLSDDPPYMMIFHPLTGLCVLRKSLFGPLELGPCSESEAWTYIGAGSGGGGRVAGHLDVAIGVPPPGSREEAVHLLSSALFLGPFYISPRISTISDVGQPNRTGNASSGADERGEEEEGVGEEWRRRGRERDQERLAEVSGISLLPSVHKDLQSQVDNYPIFEDLSALLPVEDKKKRTEQKNK